MKRSFTVDITEKVNRAYKELVRCVLEANFTADEHELREALYGPWVEFMALVFETWSMDQEGQSHEQARRLAQEFRTQSREKHLNGHYPPGLSFEEVLQTMLDGRDAAIKDLPCDGSA